MTGLEDFFDCAPAPSIAETVKGGAVLVDLSNLIFRSIYGSGEFKNESQVSVDMIRHITFNILARYRKMLDKEKFPEFILAFDGGNLWREQVFPLYKCTRRMVDPEQTPAEAALGKAVGSAFGQIRDELAKSSPFSVVRSKGAEADDVIAVLAQEFALDGREVVIISGDKDMKQLLRYKGVRCWSPNVGATGGYVTNCDPKEFLYELIFKGDSGDAVPNMKAPDNTFYPVKIRQPSVYAKDLTEWKAAVDLNHSALQCEAFAHDSDLRSRYLRNRSMVDLSWLPTPVELSIREAYKEDLSNLNLRRMKFYKYLMENSLNQHLTNIQAFV